MRPSPTVDPDAIRPAGSSVVVDLRDGVVLTTSADPAHPRRVPDAAAAVQGRLVLGPDAAAHLAHHPADGWTDLLDRVGDRTPCLLAGQRCTAADLLAAAIAAAAGPVQQLTLVAPGGWRREGRTLASALTAVGLPQPRIVPDTALLPAPGDALTTSGATLVTVGARATVVRRLAPGPQGWAAASVAQLPFGRVHLEDAAVAFVRDRLDATVPLTAAQASALRAATARAVSLLATTPAAEVELPGLPPVRLLRSDLDAAVGPTLEDALAALPPAARTVPADDTLLLQGSGLPLVVQTVSSAFGRPASVLPDADVTPLLEAATVPQAPAAAAAPLPPPPVRPRTHRARTLVAASLAVLALGGGVLASEAGRDTLVRWLSSAPQAPTAQALVPQAGGPSTGGTAAQAGRPGARPVPGQPGQPGSTPSAGAQPRTGTTAPGAAGAAPAGVSGTPGTPGAVSASGAAAQPASPGKPSVSGGGAPAPTGAPGGAVAGTSAGPSAPGSTRASSAKPSAGAGSGQGSAPAAPSAPGSTTATSKPSTSAPPASTSKPPSSSTTSKPPATTSAPEPEAPRQTTPPPAPDPEPEPPATSAPAPATTSEPPADPPPADPAPAAPTSTGDQG